MKVTMSKKEMENMNFKPLWSLRKDVINQNADSETKKELERKINNIRNYYGGKK